MKQLNHAFDCVSSNDALGKFREYSRNSRSMAAPQATLLSLLCSLHFCLTCIILWHTYMYSVHYEANLANLPGCCQPGWTQDWLCIFVSVPVPQHSVLTACESDLYDED